MLNFNQFIEWSFLAIIGGSVAWSARFLSRISQSVMDLNTKLAVVLERTAWQGKEIEEHRHRLNRLEREKPK